MKKLLLSIIAVLITAGLYAQTYYIAGNGTGDTNGKFCDGIYWDPAGSMMDQEGGIWVKTYYGVAPGTYEFKITEGTWSSNWGGSSYIGIPAEGIISSGDNMKFTISLESDITIKFNGSNIIALESTNGFGVLVINVYSVIGDSGLVGSSSDFDETGTQGDMTSQGDGTWRVTFSGVPAGIYGYKVVGNHSYAVYEHPGSEVNAEAVITIDDAYVTIVFNPALDYDDRLYYIESDTAPSKVNDNLINGIQLSAYNGTITCSVENFSIYNILGVDVTANNGQLEGIYIVKTGNVSHSIYVAK